MKNGWVNTRRRRVVEYSYWQVVQQKPALNFEMFLLFTTFEFCNLFFSATNKKLV